MVRLAKCILLSALTLCLNAEAQIDINQDINDMIGNVKNKNSKKKDNSKKGEKGKKEDKKKKKETEQLFPVYDIFPDESEFDKIIVDDIKVFETTENVASIWGDPVANPRIRRNRASNLFGQVRHNPDGSRRWHHGFDIKAPIGTPIMSVCAGTVRGVGNNGGYGLCVLIEHKVKGKSYFSFFAHLSSAQVKSGQNVNKGTIIGRSGTSGNAAGMRGEDEHVHVEYRTSAHGGARSAKDPNAILKTKFYSADPKNGNQAAVGVVRKYKP